MVDKLKKSLNLLKDYLLQHKDTKPLKSQEVSLESYFFLFIILAIQPQLLEKQNSTKNE
jgi:hypothetical protein